MKNKEEDSRKVINISPDFKVEYQKRDARLSSNPKGSSTAALPSNQQVESIAILSKKTQGIRNMGLRQTLQELPSA